MDLFKKVGDAKEDFTTYPKTFEGYKWYKPILVLVVSVIIYAIFIFLAVEAWGLFASIIGPLSSPSQGNVMDGFDTFYGIFSSVLIALAIPALYLATKIVRDRPFSSYLTSVGRWDWVIFAKSAAVFLAVYLIVQIADALIYGFELDIKLTVLTFFALIIITPFQCFAEELICRGFMMQTLGSWFRIPAVAIIIQAIIFTLGHGYNVTGMLTVFVSGLCFGFLTWYTKGLEVSSAMHSINNIMSFTIAGITTTAIATDIPLMDGILDIILNLAAIAVLFLIEWKFNWISLKKNG
jgi:membrane protease YdiL (CAAX protease family)